MLKKILPRSIICCLSIFVICGFYQLLKAQNNQTGTITGQIIDEAGRSLPGANIILKGLRRGTASNPDGNYRLNNVPAGKQTLKVSFVGYEEAQVSVRVIAGKTVVQDLQLNPSTIHTDEVVIRAQRDILRTLQTKRQSIAMVDVIDQATVQQLPVQDMTEALDRLPGVNIQGQSAGRGFRNSFVVIRGIQPSLNQVTVMGVPLVSTTGDRAVALDVLPSSMSSQLEVVKSPTADMDANTIGGTVNLIPLSAFDRQGPHLSASVKGGIVDEQGSINGDDQPFDINLIGSTRLSNKFGIAASVNYTQEEFSRTTSQPDGWEPIPQDGFPDDLYVPEGTRLEQSQSSFQRVNGTLSLDWRPNPDSRISFLGSHTESEDSQLSTQTEWNYADGKSEIDFEMRPNNRIYSPTGENEKEMDIDDQQERLSFLIGKGEFLFNKWTWTINSSYSRAESNVSVREWSFDSQNFESVIDLSGRVPYAEPVDQQAFDDPSSYIFDEIDIEPEDQVTESIQFSSDLQHDTDLLGPGGYLKIGGMYRHQDTFSDANEMQMEYNEGAGFSDISLSGLGISTTMDNVLGRPVSPLISPFSGPDFIDNNPNFLYFNQAASLGNDVTEDYEVQENVGAGYLMGNTNIGRLRLTAGIRVEFTNTESTVRTFNENTAEIGQETFSNSYANVLPNVHLRYQFSDNLQARIAGTYTIARPGLNDLGRSRSVDFDNSDIIEGDEANPVLVSSASVEQGNPDLDPFKSANIDAAIEFYRRRGSFYSVGVFYKNIDNPIFIQSLERNDVTLGSTQYREIDFEQPLNAESGSLTGVEAQMQETFTFLPGPLRNLGVTANVVYLDSEFEIPGREAEELPFFRQPDVILAVTPFWGYRGFEARLAFQHTGEFVNSYGSNALEDEIAEDRSVIDLQVSYDFLDHYSVNFGIENMTNEPVGQTYQGRSDRISNIDIEGTQYWFGLRADF